VVANAPEPRRSHVRASFVALGALVLAAAPLVPNLPLPVRLIAGLVALVAFAVAATLRPKRHVDADAFLIGDDAGLSRVSSNGTTRIVDWNAPFGVTLLASYGRPQGLLAFTTPTQTRYVPARIDGRSEADDEVLSRVAVLADLDLVEGVTHDAALSSSDAAALVRHAEARHRDALGRAYLTDGRGAPISLDRATLSIANRSFDLTSHLEWRALMFHESTGQASALYQGTWIRQSGSEVVLVAPMPASVVPRDAQAHREATGRLGRTLTRDLRLLQSPAEPPPIRDIRVAIDRPFMMLVRRVLDDAPLASRVSLPAPKEPRVRSRDSIA
jgi:hypothetical protein